MKKMLAFGMTFLLLLTAVGCGSTNVAPSPETTPSDTLSDGLPNTLPDASPDTAPDASPDVSHDTPPVALTETEIAEVNAYFAPVVWGEDETITQVRPVSCFFTSYYDDVKSLNFEEFMRYFPGDGDGTPVSDAEFEALKTVACWPFKNVEKRENMPVPISKYPRSSVDAALLEYANITTEDLDTSAVAYLEEYDAYYNYTSDFGPGMFQCVRGEAAGDIVRLYSEYGVLTLEKADDHYWIAAYQENDGA